MQLHDFMYFVLDLLNTWIPPARPNNQQMPDASSTQENVDIDICNGLVLMIYTLSWNPINAQLCASPVNKV